MWFKKTKDEKDDESRKELMEATIKRGEAIDYLIKKIDQFTQERRLRTLPFDGPERRHA
jgi:hypothetical protein